MSKLIPLSRPRNFYSPLRYPGGKAVLAHFFSKVIDLNNITNCTYVEPYAGGAGAALTLLFTDKVAKIVINDLDPSIYAFWKSVLYESERFIAKLEATEINITEWHQQRQTYKNPQASDFDRGFATLYLNRTNHSGIIESRPIGGLDQVGAWKMDSRFDRKKMVDRIRKLVLYKDRIQVNNLDGITLMKKVYQQSNVFIYVDPPYYDKGSLLYLNHYVEADHVKLAKFLNARPNFYWLLTYDNVADIKKLYAERAKYEFNLFYHTNQPKKSKEILIRSDSMKIQ